MTNIYDFTATTITGQEKPMADFKGQVVLVVNTASKCGLTPQFKDPAGNDEISQFCELNYGVTFPMFAKIDVNGDGAHPLFKHLKSSAPGLLGSEAIKWNFTKFLVDRNGNVVERYAPTTEPEKIAKDIAKLL